MAEPLCNTNITENSSRGSHTRQSFDVAIQPNPSYGVNGAVITEQYEYSEPLNALSRKAINMVSNPSYEMATRTSTDSETTAGSDVTIIPYGITKIDTQIIEEYNRVYN